MSDQLTSAGLFAGIGGIELGLEGAGFATDLLCEIDPAASAVLTAHFPHAAFASDVRALASLPEVDVLAAGFPCQDLSQAGRKAGIGGSQSSLVGEVFRLCSDRTAGPDWLVLENVSYMLKLDRGRAMHDLVRQLEQLGFQWAYRVVDARAFGVPQRRQRVVLVASRTHDAREVLFADEANGPDYDDAIGPVDPTAVYGFYWTEGLRGLGWAKNAVPTVKGGSRVGIPSPPAIWVPAVGSFGTPQIEDAERLQGFDAGWTEPALDAGRSRGSRWRLVGNAVCVPMSTWLGQRLRKPSDVVATERVLSEGERWPVAAWGARGQTFAVDISMRPFDADVDLIGYLRTPLRPLSIRAGTGFLRARRGNLRFAEHFLEDLETYLDRGRALRLALGGRGEIAQPRPAPHHGGRRGGKDRQRQL